MTSTMRAVVLDAPGPPEALVIRERPLPDPPEGWVSIAVRAFGLNRSELHLRRGLATNATFPRVPGIEAAGVVARDTTGELAPGTHVMTMMGGMGREFDGGYAEYVAVPREQVIPFSSDLPWSQLGAVPEMLQTAYGSLHVGVGLEPSGSLLVRGGTSSVGLSIAVLAKRIGATVLATTRSASKGHALRDAGADHILVDDGEVAPRVRELFPRGVDGAVELVGTNTLPDTLRSVRRGGVACFTGMLSDHWTIPDFYPMDYIPNGVRLTAYHGGSNELPQHELQAFLDDVAAGAIRIPIGHAYAFDEIVQAHRDMEQGTWQGKLVVTVP